MKKRLDEVKLALGNLNYKIYLSELDNLSSEAPFLEYFEQEE